jgi:hypothetical protein
LVRLHHKDLTLSQWTDYARCTLFEGKDVNSAGFILACDSRGTIYGIAQFEKRIDAEGNRQVIARNIMASGLFQQHRSRVITVLRQALDQMAQESGSAPFVVEHPARLPLSPAIS